MKTSSIFSFLLFIAPACCAQSLTMEQLLKMAEVPKPKMETLLAKKGYNLSGTAQRKDTTDSRYNFVKPAKLKIIDSTFRSVCRAEVKDFCTITYQTSSAEEFKHLKNELTAIGFISYAEQADTSSRLLYQQKDITVQTNAVVMDSIICYHLKIHKKAFPLQEDINYADDLLAFSSHEYLVYYFGENNVKKDFYFFSGNEISKCSVLFPNTSRQVVYIWEDDINKRSIANLLFGGQQQLKSAIDGGGFVGESNWVFKSGVRAGMTLFELRRLNESNFKFYGGNSSNSGGIAPENTGKLNFKKEDIILGCVNCNDNKFANASIINADDALADGRIVFVLSVILNPEPGHHQD